MLWDGSICKPPHGIAVEAELWVPKTRPAASYIDSQAKKKLATGPKISRRQPLCKKLAVSASSRGVISTPSPGAETPLDAGGRVPATARGAGTLRAAAAAVRATARGPGTRHDAQRRRRERRRRTLRRKRQLTARPRRYGLIRSLRPTLRTAVPFGRAPWRTRQHTRCLY